MVEKRPATPNPTTQMGSGSKYIMQQIYMGETSYMAEGGHDYAMRGWEHAEMFQIPLKLFLVTFIAVRSIALCPGIL